MYTRLERFLLGPRFACIETEIQSERILFRMAVLSRSGKTISHDLITKSTDDPATLHSFLNKKTPVALVVTGKGVIHKIHTGNIALSDEALLKVLLPNASFNEILLSRNLVGDNCLLASMVRKETVQKIIDLFPAASFVSIVIGPCVVIPALEPLQQHSEQICFGNHTFQMETGKLVGVSHSHRGQSEQFEIDGAQIPDESLVVVSGAKLGLNHTSGIPGEAAGFSDRRRNFFRMKRYGAFVRTYILTILLVLTTNVFLFTHYRQIKADLQADPRINGELFIRFDELKQHAQSNEEYMKATGMNNKTSFAWIADQIGMNVPDDIILSKVSIAPEERFGRTDTIGFQHGNILITGSCREASSLNRWLRILQNTDWVENARITDYKDAGDAPGLFELEVICQ